MNGCQLCGGFGMHHDPIAHGWPTAATRPSEPDPFSPTNHRDPREERVMAERASIARGICPRSHQPIMPGGSLRPSCSFCDCGEDES